MFNNDSKIISKRSIINPTQIIIRNKKKIELSSYHDSCPNCGNTKPIFYQFQNGMFVCFICRKASLNNDNDIIRAY